MVQAAGSLGGPVSGQATQSYAGSSVEVAATTGPAWQSQLSYVGGLSQATGSAIVVDGPGKRGSSVNVEAAGSLCCPTRISGQPLSEAPLRSRVPSGEAT